MKVSASGREFVCKETFKFHVSIFMKKEIRLRNNSTIKLRNASGKGNAVFPVSNMSHIRRPLMYTVYSIEFLTGRRGFVGQYCDFICVAWSLKICIVCGVWCHR